MRPTRREQREHVLAEMAKPTKRHKFNAKRTQVDGLWFDSQKEAGRWAELCLLQKAGTISHLKRQVRYELSIADSPCPTVLGAMVIDFEYFDWTKEEWIYEDTKGVVTPLWRWKARHFEAQYGGKILET